MVRAAREIGSQPASPHRHATGLHRGPHRPPGALGHGWAPGKTDFALLGFRELPVCHGSNVARVVDQSQFPIGRGQGLLQLNLGQMHGQALTQSRILGHGKAVPIGQRQHEMIGVEGLHKSIVRAMATGCRDPVIEVNTLYVAAQQKTLAKKIPTPIIRIMLQRSIL
jgi:hypothetical protein